MPDNNVVNSDLVVGMEAKKYPDFDDVDLGIIVIGIIAIVLLILLIVYLSVAGDKANPSIVLGVISSAITAIATLAGRRTKVNGTNGQK